MKISGLGGMLAATAVALGAMSFAPGQAAALCIVNESPVPLRLYINSGSVFLTAPWQITLPAGHRVCCPARRSVCRKPSATVKAYTQRAMVKGNRGPRFKPKIGPWGRIPIAPINPYLGRQTVVCHMNVYRHRTVRLFWNRRHRGCEVWAGNRITGADSFPRPRRTVRRHLIVCNRTRQAAIYVAYAAWWGRQKWSTRGWFKIARNRCRRLVLPYDYRANAYVYAVGGGKVWTANHASLCLNRGAAFRLAMADRRVCPRGIQKAGFIKVALRPGANRFSFHPVR